MAWDHVSFTEEELKVIVRDVYDAKVFTSFHLRNHDNYLVSSIFMPIMFMCAPPSEPDFPKVTGDIRKDRKNKLNHIDSLEKWRNDLQEWENEKPKMEEFMNNIGMLFEDNEKAGPRAINGYPIFMSCKILSREDAGKFLDLYKKYEKMREDFEKEWK